MQKDRLYFHYNLAGKHTLIESRSPLPVGEHILGCQLSITGRSARISLTVDQESVAESDLPMAFPAGFGLLSTQCGMNQPSPVSPRSMSPVNR